MGSETVFSERQSALLVVVAKGLYPHPDLPEAPYRRVVQKITEQAVASPELATTLRDGIDDLSPWILDNCGIGQPAFEARLRRIERTEFFRTLLPLVAWHLYDDPETRAHIGYPGASYAEGGYLHRGFDDLRWLPEPRVAEPDEPLVEIGPLPYPLDATDDVTAS
ncbi:hypothetical protein WEH80_15335 [Actinomycetes bacterium KLBMP 9759]